MKRNQSLSLLIFITLFLLLEPAYCSVDQHYEACVPKRCGNQSISFPFRIEDEQKSYCGHPGFDIVCRENRPILHVPEEEHSDLIIQQIFYNNQSLRVFSPVVLDLSRNCLPDFQSNFSLDRRNTKFKFASNVSDLFLFYNCSNLSARLLRYNIRKCGDENSSGLAIFGGDENLRYAVGECERSMKVPVGSIVGNGETIANWGELEGKVGGILVKWTASNCNECAGSGGRCGFDLDNHVFKCYCSDRPHSAKCHNSAPGKNHLKLILAIVLPIPLAIIFSSILCIIFCRKKWKVVSPFIRRNISFAPFSKADLEGSNICFEVPLFSYAELQEATKNFAQSQELGDGGFGTVYYGKLKDGREVAVKRLYDHNYKRLSQFINEIEILARIRHRNLVSLYGCTSRRSQELLLVYEYIPNGTVADHLNGGRGSLTWPIRMKIAIETASALAYLHASDIIHRDVKTTNILLDNSFCVKVADFGLSRLVPTDVTHVSTGPQGTPGYVDPEYHQCYQLTDKSDVYSFGVVLIELISSMPAVDISRHRHEINLANLAINKIQSHALSDLIDPSLGFYSDVSIERMITSVAEVAFRCLQLEKEMRPTMDEVLTTLKEILEYRDEKTGEEEGTIDDGGLPRSGGMPHASPTGGDDVLLLKNQKAVPPSPDSVTARWIVSSSDTSICSG